MSRAGLEARAGFGRGFTLVEVLLVLTLAAVVGSAAVSLLVEARRSYRRSAETIDARQRVRAALDLIAAEVRQASPADLLAATPDSFALRFDVARSVVCDSSASDRVALVQVDSVRAPNLPASFRGIAMAEPYDSGFTYLDGWSPSPGQRSSGPRARCAALGAPLDLVLSRYREAGGFRGKLGRLPLRGTLLRSYGRLAYRFGASSFDAGLALRRNGQELAAPFDTGSRFSYVMTDGAERASVAAGRLDSIRAVRVRLVVPRDARDGPPGGPARAPSEHLVYLRN